MSWVCPLTLGISGVPDLTSAKGPLAKTDAVLLDHIINGYESPGSDMAMPESMAGTVISSAVAHFYRQKQHSYFSNSELEGIGDDGQRGQAHGGCGNDGGEQYPKKRI